MRSADQWFDLYGESHQNPTNKLIHWICVPTIMFTVIALFWELTPASWNKYSLEHGLAVAGIPLLNIGVIFMIAAWLFYLITNFKLAIGMAVVAVGMLYLTYYLWSLDEAGKFMELWQFALIVFVVAWIGQFIGHKIEGKKPSFLTDLQFLLVGPMWLLGFVYKSLGIRY